MLIKHCKVPGLRQKVQELQARYGEMGLLPVRTNVNIVKPSGKEGF